MRRIVITIAFTIAFIPIFLIFISPPAGAFPATPQFLTIFHTNDLHSHLMPYAPELDYIPDRTNIDTTIGGFARIATVLNNERNKRSNPSFTLDAGDFTMGTLFHTLAREESFELRLMHQMGYDYVTLGNHEFDMFPDGLAQIITTAHNRNQLPGIVFSNAIFSGESDKDDSLEAVFQKGLVKPYAVAVVDGLRIGFYGIMGKIAAGDAPFAAPVTFRDPIKTSRDMVRILREEENVDIVICLSHSGLYMANASEDMELAAEVPGIDIIISGHSHTLLEEPLVVNDTIIVQAGRYGGAIGALDFSFYGGKITLQDYNLIKIDDSIPADPEIRAQIDRFITKIDQQVLSEHNLSYWEIIGNTDFDLPLRLAESPVGNFLADAIRWYVNKHDYNPEDPATRVQMAIKANGVIRADILKGQTGKLAVADVFRTLPLGIGMDEQNTPGYPLVTCYIHAYEIKRALEVITTVYPLRGSAYFLQLSGVKFTYNPYRVPFDRVTDIRIQSEYGVYVPLDYSRANENLYRVAANIYEATFLQVIGDFTYDILTIIPKDRHGNPIESLLDFRVDANPREPGIQELKEWIALIRYISHFSDRTGNGLADIPDHYRNPEGRIMANASVNPISLLYRGTFVTWAAFALILTVSGIVILILRLVVGRVKRKNR